MAIETTHNGAVALYDSVRMEAFGPIFEDSERAEDFVTWVSQKTDMRLPEMHRETIAVLHVDWMRERLDDDGYLLETGS